jgi:hypothetical protein
LSERNRAGTRPEGCTPRDHHWGFLHFVQSGAGHACTCGFGSIDSPSGAAAPLRATPFPSSDPPSPERRSASPARPSEERRPVPASAGMSQSLPPSWGSSTRGGFRPDATAGSRRNRAFSKKERLLRPANPGTVPPAGLGNWTDCFVFYS